MKTMEVSEKERQFILDKRAEKQLDTRKQDFRKLILKVMSLWIDYSAKTGDELTFSTFMNDFDCDSHIPFEYQKDRQLIMAVISASAYAADQAATQLT